MAGPVAPIPQMIYVAFSAEINAHTSEALIGVMADLVNKRVPGVTLLLSTPGGNVMNGITLYNVLRAMPFTLTTHNVGNVDSIGNAIFLAGSIRYACPHSTFMFHGVGFNSGQGQRFEEKDCRERLDSIMADQRRIGSIMRERAHIADDVVEGLFREAQTKDAIGARDLGITQEIRDVQVPVGGPVIPLVFQR
jgi:ATP-dependent Clp protease protease subunit